MTLSRRHLLLLGGGHSHLHVLRMAAMQPLSGVRLTLVSPDVFALYSGMVPGVLAGLYELGDARIDLRALAARAGVRFIVDRAVRIDAAARRVELAALPPLHYDVLSIDIGSRPRRLPEGERPSLLPIKPIETALTRLGAYLDAVRGGASGGRAIVVGAGAGGVEVAFALRARLREIAAATVTVVDALPHVLPGHPPRAAALVADRLRRYGIEFVGGVAVREVTSGGVLLVDGRALPADLVVWATGAEALPLLRESGLTTDESGFLLVSDALQSVSDPAVFAAGDCATLTGHPQLPKAGVFAVREGPVLWRNLGAALAGKELRPYRPQRDFLSLLSTGDRRAVLSYYGAAAHGRWAWRLKDWIDRRFIALHAPPRADDIATPERSAAAMSGAPMAPCGGCAAKVGGAVLSRVLRRLDVPADPRVVIGLEAPDDAAVITHPPGAHVVSTVDFFPPFLDDPYLVGAVAAVNAVSDLYAMGAEPRAALALVALPAASEAETEETLELLLAGALTQLQILGVALVGGHTIEGRELLFGLSVTGACMPEALFRTGGARPGDVLVLTKQLGTGVVLAAARAGAAPAEWTEATIASMLWPNRAAAAALQQAGVRACTDVTGFGLAGHLLEMLRAAGVGARLSLSALPALPGAVELLSRGWRSSFHERNAAQRRAVGGSAAVLADPRVELAFDPQTSGGLLAAVPSHRVESLCEALRAGGDACVVVGTIVTSPESVIEIVP